MQANRAEWQRRIEEDITSRQHLSDDEKMEELTKWKKREMVFNNTVIPLIEEAKSICDQTDQSPAGEAGTPESRLLQATSPAVKVPIRCCLPSVSCARSEA